MKIDLGSIIEKFSQLDVKIRYGLVAFVCLVFILGDFFTVISFQSSWLGKVNDENQELNQNIERLNGDIQRMNQINAGLKASREQLEGLNSKVRPAGEVFSILKDISHVAHDTGVQIDEITPKKEAQTVLITTDALKYYSLPIVIQASSGYHMFVRFLDQLEAGKLFFTVSNLSVQSNPQDIHHHSINVVLNIVLSDKNTDGAKK